MAWAPWAGCTGAARSGAWLAANNRTSHRIKRLPWDRIQIWGCKQARIASTGQTSEASLGNECESNARVQCRLARLRFSRTDLRFGFAFVLGAFDLGAVAFGALDETISYEVRIIPLSSASGRAS